MVGLPAIFLDDESEGESREGKGREGRDPAAQKTQANNWHPLSS